VVLPPSRALAFIYALFIRDQSGFHPRQGLAFSSICAISILSSASAKRLLRYHNLYRMGRGEEGHGGLKDPN
jgi:hypothetical protein